MAITQVSNSLVKQDLTISGGTVDNTVIGSGTPAAGTFTTITGTLASTVTGTTAAASDNSTKIATTAYVTTALANLVDSAPGTLNTLNELAAALGDDANFSTTVTNSIAAKAALAGATFTGDISSPNIKATTEFQVFSGGTDIGAIFNSGGALTIQGTSTRDVSIGSDTSTNAIFVEGTNGRVGIGTTGPAQLFHVSAGASASTTVRFGQNFDTAIEIGPVSATASGMLKFLNASGTSKVSMGFRDSGSGTDGAFRIRRGATLDSSGSFINFGTDGTVQIEKSNVSNPHVDSFAALIVEDSEARLQLISDDSGDEASTLLLSNVNKHWGINNHGPDQGNRFGIGYYASSSSGIDIASNLSDALSIGTNGYVGLGTTTLNKFFNLVDPAQGGEQIKLHFEASSGADLWSIYSYDRVNSHYTNMLLGQYTYIKSGGEVSIGNINGDFRVNQKLGVVGAGVRGGISVSSYINAATSAVFDFNKSRHPTPGNHTVVQNNDALGVLIWRGDDGDEFVDGAAISAVVDNTPGNGDMPARLEFFTSPDGTGGMREVMRIDSKANLLLGDGVTANGSLGTKFTDTSGFQIGKPGVDNRSGIIMMEQYAYQNTWITFLDVHDVNATGVTFLLNAVRLADQNRHCTRLVRYAYNQSFTSITTSQQNTSIEFRVSSGSLQYRFTSAGTYGVSIIIMAGG